MNPGDDLDDKKREATSMFRIGLLLTKQRSEKKARLVEQILRESIDIEEKIARIQSIDLNLDEDNLADAKPRAPDKRAKSGKDEKPEPPEPDDKVANRAIPEPMPSAGLDAEGRRLLLNRLKGVQAQEKQAVRQAARNRMRLLQSPKMTGVIHYFIFEYRRIRVFGTACGMLERGRLPFTLKVSLAAEVLVQKTLKQDLVPALAAILGIVLKNGWMFLEKKTYNAVAALRSLCLTIEKLEFHPGTTNELSLVAALSPAASQLVLFLSQHELPERVIEAIVKTCEHMAIADDTRLRGPVLVRTLLDQSSSQATLCNLVRAIMMHHFRHWIDTEDLLSKTKATLIVDDMFDCDEEVQEKIDRYIKSTVARLDTLETSRLEAFRLRYFIPEGKVDDSAKAVSRTVTVITDNDGGPISEPARPSAGSGARRALYDFEVLKNFYEGSPYFLKYEFDPDRHYIIIIAVRFIDVFLQVFEPLLVTGIKIPQGNVQLFHKGVLATFTDKLRVIREFLQKNTAAKQAFSTIKFTAMRRDPAQGSQVEAQIVSNVLELGTIMTSIARTLSDIVRNRSRYADPALRSWAGDEPSYPLTHELQVILNEGQLNGKQVLESLILGARVSYLAGILFGDLSMLQPLESMTGIRLQALELMENIKRIASAEQTEEVRKMYEKLCSGEI